jgi:hypothetical protein
MLGSFASDEPDYNEFGSSVSRLLAFVLECGRSRVEREFAVFDAVVVLVIASCN